MLAAAMATAGLKQVPDVVRRSQTRQQNTREEKRMRVTRDGKSSPLADSGITTIRRNYKTSSDSLETAARLMDLHSRQLACLNSRDHRFTTDVGAGTDSRL